MATYRIMCREKHSLYERIISIGCAEVGTGATQRFTEDEAINRIEKRIDNFYVERPEGHRVKVIVAVHEGRKYIKTEADGEKPDNLLSLPHCAEKPKVNPVVPPTRVVPAGSHSVRL
ncbi:MAG: DUF3892 domain-containing protein [Acidobacteriaceae bacterium]